MYVCIIKHIREFLSRYLDIHHIIIYSDGCFYKNHNVTLFNAILYFCEVQSVTIEQKYLVVGHTQMECDALQINFYLNFNCKLNFRK